MSVAVTSHQVTIDTDDTKNSFSIKEHKAQSSGGFVLKKGGRVRIRLDNDFHGVGFNIHIYLYTHE